MKKLTIIFIAVVLLLITMLPVCSRLILKNKMLDKYSDNQNYVSFSGKVVEVDGLVVIIQCKELNAYLSYEDDLCEYYIHAEQVLDLKVGDEIQFTTVPFHFYNGHLLPIVELKISGDIILEFAEGKDNLLDWVNDAFSNAQ